MARDETNGDDSTSDPRPDDVLRPDAVSSGDAGGHREDTAFGLDDVAERAVELLLGLLRRAGSLAGGVLIFTTVTCVVGYGLGVAALGGGLRTFWMVAGGAVALWAIGSVTVASWRLRAVRTGSDMMIGEVRSLIGGDDDSQRTVIETVESTEASHDEGIVVLSRQFFSLRDAVKDRRSDFAQLSAALASITTLPAALALATVVGFVFTGLSVIFALVLLF